VFSKNINPGDSFSFGWAGSICTSKDFNDPQAESERMVIYLLRENSDKMIQRHKQLWAELWEGDIIIEGDPESQQDVRLALYHLYAFSAAGTRLSVPPMGLSSQNYNGHIFWDSELWMYPPLLAFHPELASSMLDYRYDRLEKARQKARNFGYKGAMFPWESDDTGEEATPPWALTGTFEHHITADVGIAFWNYYRVTGDKQWLKETGYPVLKEVADFWVSRAEKNTDGSWSINNVVGANEFAPNVNDNAFTNGSAKAVLQYADKAAQVLGLTAPETWKEVSDKLMFHYFENGVMKEHSEYAGDRIKQADVNLLTYPLEIVTSEEQARRDLEYYEPKIAAEGPAMGHSILSIIYSGFGDNEKAWELFKKSFEPNKRPPFGALSETAFLNNPYFCTGAGGMLQAVIFGFAGLHITENGIIQKTPCLPPHWKKLTIKGVQGRDYVVKR
jgi:trehalose/maltose hydrolase-like predicted phosphorylase